MSLLDKGLDFVDAQRLLLAIDITYQRDADEVVVKAVIGKTVFRVENGNGLVERIESRDFLVKATDLVLADEQVDPATGDRILEEAIGKIFTYEVLAPGNEPCWRYSDPQRRTLRIHTKLVTAEDA